MPKKTEKYHKCWISDDESDAQHYVEVKKVCNFVLPKEKGH